jgi:NADP-dependent 3-hydroxy acid dehydrogenase YdfG
MGPPLVWLVTGCSSGFGEQFIRSILARGDKAIAAGRDVSRLNALKEAGAAVLELDIAAEQPVLVAKIQEAIGFFGGIDVLVNNAGYVSVGTLEDLP